MPSEPFREFNLIIAIVGAMILVLALVSRRLAASPFPPVLLALFTGVVVGPEVLGLLDPMELAKRSTILEYAARVTLGISLFGVALRIGRSYPRRSWKDVAVLVGVGMPIMWVVSSLLVYIILDLPFWMSLLIGAIITPTDPVAASPIVTGDVAEKNLPERIRHAISSESGANDGISYPIVLLPILMLTKPAGEALSHWLTRTILWEVLGATAVGVVIGIVAAKLLRWSEGRELIKNEWRLIYTVSIALLTAGLGRIIGTDEILVVFAAGVAFTQLLSREDREEEDLGQEAVNRFFAVPIFALLGMTIPWDGWMKLGWNGVLLAIAVLLLRRPPLILAIFPLVRSIRSKKEALFVGWFGPIAVAAMYYASLAERKVHEPLIWDITSLVICASVLAHGFTAAALTRRMGS